MYLMSTLLLRCGIDPPLGINYWMYMRWKELLRCRTFHTRNTTVLIPSTTTLPPSITSECGISLISNERFDWIDESPDNIHHTDDEALIQKYTDGKEYEYILELDSENRVIGGEWAGVNSTTDHPDFLWMTTTKPNRLEDSFHRIKYSQVSKLLANSVACDRQPVGTIKYV
jgi:hypothetical protein